MPDKDERIALLERELSLARAQLANETAARRALEDQLVEQHKQVHAHPDVGQEADELIKQLLEIASSYHQTNVKALELATAEPAPPTNLDLSDPIRAITVLRSFDHDGLLAAIAKSESTIRKWQKHCKKYRESAKNKISFRDFVVGDLALFLPTRNSPLRPWAAFNGTRRALYPLSLLTPTPRVQSRFRTISFKRLVVSLSN